MCKVKQVVIFLCVVNLPAVVLALGTEDFGDKPIEPSADWPAGTVAMVESPSRVYSRWVNGGEYFCYKGDIKAFNNALKKFAAIEAPTHQLIIEDDYGKTGSFDGKKEIPFDWRLDVTEGISRSSLIEKGATEKELSPKLTYYLGRNEGKLEALILPENIKVTCSADANDDRVLEYKLKQVLKWRTAKCRWAEFADRFIETQRERLKGSWPGSELPISGYLEFQSQLISKYLPDYKIYIIENSVISVSDLFAVSVAGEIFDLNWGYFGLKDGNGSFSKFIASQHIQVSDVNTAIDVGKFVEELVFAPGRWGSLRRNLNNFRIIKAWLFSRDVTIEDPDWQWYAEKCDIGWVVSKCYTGSASIEVPPKWEVTVDKDNRIVKINRR